MIKNNVGNLPKIANREQLIDILTGQTEEAEKYLGNSQICKLKIAGIRNLKIGIVIGKSLIPFVIMSAIVFPTMNKIGVGYPFIGGTQKEYSQTSYTYNSNGQIIEQEPYNSKYISRWASVNVVSGWQLNEDNKYERITYYYSFKNGILNEKTIDILLQGDMEYLKELLGEPRVSVEFANIITSEESINPDEYSITLEFTKADEETVVLTKTGTMETVMSSLLYLCLLAVIVCFQGMSSNNIVVKIRDLIDRYNPEMMSAISDIRQNNLERILKR